MGKHVKKNLGNNKFEIYFHEFLVRLQKEYGSRTRNSPVFGLEYSN